jgi:hypothetical protein
MAGWRLSDDVVTTEDVLRLVTACGRSTSRPATGTSTAIPASGRPDRRARLRKSPGLHPVEIFGPVGMPRTVFREVHGEIVKRHAYGCKLLDRPLELRMPNYDLTGPTNLLTTVEDLGRWERNLSTGQSGDRPAPAATDAGNPERRHADSVRHGPDRATLPRPPRRRARRPRRRLSITLHSLPRPAIRRGVWQPALPDTALPGVLVRRVADIYLANQLGPLLSPRPAGDSTRGGTRRQGGLLLGPPAQEIARVLVEQASLRLDFRGSVCARPSGVTATPVVLVSRLHLGSGRRTGIHGPPARDHPDPVRHHAGRRNNARRASSTRAATSPRSTPITGSASRGLVSPSSGRSTRPPRSGRSSSMSSPSSAEISASWGQARSASREIRRARSWDFGSTANGSWASASSRDNVAGP